MRRLEAPFGTPPTQTLVGVGKCCKDSLCWSLDRDFLDDLSSVPVSFIDRLHIALEIAQAQLQNASSRAANHRRRVAFGVELANASCSGLVRYDQACGPQQAKV
jgi:hypothetical protein